MVGEGDLATQLVGDGAVGEGLAGELVPDAKFERQYFGIAVAKGNSELLGKINAGLQKIVADGTYAKIYKTWFDDNVPTLPAQ
ncbi:transporter substrate-binding domain-containing protein [Klebsiella pneumoniae]|uniref:transporter substrate-binding domain-containing protein n=1 Tax=Klebsiella pneumoniae TaxID=573 RepID=UPI003857D459